MSRLSVLLKDFNYLVYDIGFHYLLYDEEENMFADIEGNDLYSILEYYTDGAVECIGIYDFGRQIFGDLDDHPVLGEYISEDKLFSGIVMAPAAGSTLTYNQISNIVEALKSLRHCSNIGNIYAAKLDHIEGQTIYTLYDNTDIGGGS